MTAVLDKTADPDTDPDEDEAPAPDTDPDEAADADPLQAMRFVFDPASWTIFEVMEMRKALGYKTREDFENTVQGNEELLQVGCAWLALRGTEFADVPPAALMRRVRASQFDRPAVPKQTPKS